MVGAPAPTRPTCSSIQTCATLPLDNGTGGNTDAFFCNPQYDKLFNQQVTQFDQTQRSADDRADAGRSCTTRTPTSSLYYKNWLSALRTDKVTNYLYGSPDSKGFYPLQNHLHQLAVGDAGVGEQQLVPDRPSGSGSGWSSWWCCSSAAAVLLRRRSTAGERE